MQRRDAVLRALATVVAVVVVRGDMRDVVVAEHADEPSGEGRLAGGGVADDAEDDRSSHSDPGRYLSSLARSEAAGRYDAGMEAPPAVWTVAPGADDDEAKDLVARLADHLGIQPPQITNGMVMLPADYPRVARALDRCTRTGATRPC